MIGPRHFLLSGIALFALTGGAVAADVPVKGPVYTKAPAAFSWEGQYIGIHGGYLWAENDSVFGGVNPVFDHRAGYVGVQFGYLHHLSRNWLIGYEVDVSFGNISETVGLATSEIKYFGTARTRLGYVQGPWLYYATAGVAWANTEIFNAATLFERHHVGYAIGAGIEYAFARNWTARVEYLFADLGEANLFTGAGNVNQDLTLSTLRFALNYRFANWSAAPVLSNYPTKAPIRTAGWTGPYIGIHGGYSLGDFTSSNAGAVTPFEPSGGIFGIQSGYNWQVSGNLVFGIEADSSWGRVRDTVGTSVVDIDMMGTARARLGYANGNMLTYGTGGLAWIHADTSLPAVGIVRDQFYLGWTAGVGIEYAFSPRWSGKLEYLYSRYDLTDSSGIGVLDDDGKLHTIKLGLNYRAGIFDLLGMRW